jgi:hypothetical protein
MIPEMFMLLGFLMIIVGGLIIGFFTGDPIVMATLTGIGTFLFVVGLIGYLKTRTTAYDEFHGER